MTKVFGRCQDVRASQLSPPYDVIVCADVVYRSDLFEPLATALYQLSSHDTIIYLGILSLSDHPLATLLIS